MKKAEKTAKTVTSSDRSVGENFEHTNMDIHRMMKSKYKLVQPR